MGYSTVADNSPTVTIIKKEINCKNYILKFIRELWKWWGLDELKFQRGKSQLIECFLLLKFWLMPQRRMNIRYGSRTETAGGKRHWNKLEELQMQDLFFPLGHSWVLGWCGSPGVVPERPRKTSTILGCIGDKFLLQDGNL